jgi:hypothetical protein
MNPSGMQNMDPAALMAVYGVAIFIGLVVALGVSAVVCYFVHKLYDAVPAGKRELEPTSKVWLLMIPCFNLYYNFQVFPGLARSLRAVMTEKGVAVDDQLEKFGLWYSIASCCCIIPCLNYVAGPTALVLLVLFLVKGYEQKKAMGVA